MNTMDMLIRNAIGFDRLFALAEEKKLSGYPPYNIEVLDENHYLISMAIAGFDEADIKVTLHEGTLTVVGNRTEDNRERQFIHRGIAERAFTQQFELDNYIEVKDAHFKHGILNITLVKNIPQSMQPKQIPINIT